MKAPPKKIVSQDRYGHLFANQQEQQNKIKVDVQRANQNENEDKTPFDEMDVNEFKGFSDDLFETKK